MSDKFPRKKSLVDYSKISDRPVQDARFAKAAKAPSIPEKPDPVAEASAPRMSTQMDAVMRLMTGREERTIAEKMADSNRPTWEAYKKENESKLNMDGADEKKMEEYRRELDKQRDRLLARASGRDSKKRKKKKKRRRRESDSDSSSESSRSESRQEHRRRKKQRKKHKKESPHRRQNDNSDSGGSGRRSRKKHEKRRKKRDESGNESDGSHYKLSRFFSEGTENNS